MSPTKLLLLTKNKNKWIKKYTKMVRVQNQVILGWFATL